MRMLQTLRNLHAGVFGSLDRFVGDGFLSFLARLVFSSVLLFYFLNSAATKVGSGFPGILIPQMNGYAQILPSVMEKVGYDASQIAFFPYGLIVLAGTYAEFLLPVLILLGLFTRLASLGMIGFIAVMTYVDIAFHGVDAATIGAMFDRHSDAVIADQRLLWVFPLVYLVVRGGGALSLDALLGHWLFDRS